MNLHSLTEAAALLSISAVRLRQLCQRGQCGQKIGGVWLLTEEEIRQLRRRAKPGRPKKQP